MELWTDEIESMRAEAREVVSAGIGLVRGAIGRDETPPADPLERARWARDAFETIFVRAPEAEPMTIAGVPCRVFRPEREARAVFVHFHGGGMILGAPEMNDTQNLALARGHGVAVVSVDYRLAPEHPFPAGPDDGTAVVEWLLDHAAAEFGSDRLVFGGESAGGYMAAAVALRTRDELGAIDRVLGLDLVFGVYDWGRSPSQRGIRPHDGPDLLDPEGITFFCDCYLPGLSGDERRDPSVSPAFADVRGMPPAFFSVGSTDHLLDDTLILAARWAAAGNTTELFVAPDMPHGFMAFPCGITTAWEHAVKAWLADRLVAS